MVKKKSSGRKSKNRGKDCTKKVVNLVAVLKDVASILLAIKTLLD